MPRPLWTGSISFGLVNVPVRLYSAVREHTLHFHLVHAPDSSPVGYQKICKAEGKPVPDDEIVKAFEHRKGEYVFMDDEDFERARDGRTRTIDVSEFVAAEEIDPIFFAKPYYLGPAEGAEKVYALLARALEESGLVAIVKFVLRDRQHLGALRVRERVITLEQLHFADEIQPVDEIRPSGASVGKEELRMARRLIESGARRWEPGRYRDTYREELEAAIEAKRKGRQVHQAAEVEEEERPVDLLEALRASLERTRKGGGGSGRRAGRGEALEQLSKSELERRARDAGIEGRSKMSKGELVEALRSAA